MKSKMNRGVIYYNVGTSCIVRLLVSLHSLRQHYHGPVTILSDGKESEPLCRKVAWALKADFKEWQPPIRKGPNWVYLAKTCYHLATPYDFTIALDADTLIMGTIDELFEEAEDSSFCVAQLGLCRSNWKGIAERILAWERWLPKDIKPALAFGPAINCGVVAFSKNSVMYRDWSKLALPGRTNFIPDETCCQVVLHRYPHKVLSPIWNRSCRYDNPEMPGTRIIHYHGRNHCRLRLPYFGHLWMEALNRIRTENIAHISEWIPAQDRVLSLYLRSQHSFAKSDGMTKRSIKTNIKPTYPLSDASCSFLRPQSMSPSIHCANPIFPAYKTIIRTRFPKAVRQHLQTNNSTTTSPSLNFPITLPIDSSTSPLITVIMLSWKRPDNVCHLALHYCQLPVVAEMIVANNNSEITLKKIHPKLKIINLTRDLGLFTRFAAASLSRTATVLLVDDDLCLPEQSLLYLLKSWREDPQVMHGIVGRNTSQDEYSKTPVVGACEIVLTRAAVVSTSYCTEALSYAHAFNKDLGGSPQGNGEDILLSYVVSNASQRLNMAHALSITELPAPDSIHHRIANHLEHRSSVVRWCLEHVIGGRKPPNKTLPHKAKGC